MSDACKLRKVPRCQRSIYKVHYCLERLVDNNMARPFEFSTDPEDIQAFDRQVAGHLTTENAKYLGLLHCSNGTILKPIIKECQQREVDFYIRMQTPEDPYLLELKEFVPKYFGCRRFCYNGFEQNYIILENATERMLEPCIMDVKIGKRTWDPEATDDKIRKEQSKYTQCKEQFGFCIPGFQVYKLTTGKLHKYNKDYGKKLQGQAVRDALRIFLNGSGTTLCRALILQFLTQLWKIQKWAARQKTVRLFSTSLLLIYDANKLRDHLSYYKRSSSQLEQKSSPRLRRTSTLPSIHPDSGSNFSGQLSDTGPVYRKVNAVPIMPLKLAQRTFSSPINTVKSPWSDALDKLEQVHSFENNYEEKLKKIKLNYRASLEQLSSDGRKPCEWATVKMIDFAHAFFNEDGAGMLDDNYRDGIDSFVQIFESFLRETDDQVF